MVTVTLTGAHIVVYINNKRYTAVQSVNFTVEYGEEAIFGIDSPYAQEVATTKITVRGSVNGLRTKYSGGLQAINARPLFNETLASPYVSLRIQDRQTGEDIVFIPQAKVTRESHSIVAKQKYKLNFDFTGIIPMMALDRS